MNISILKCHGSGNDFVLIDEIKGGYGFTEEQRVTLVKELCDRTKLYGSDGLLFVQESKHADAKMRFFNTDGTEAEMCGNGVRCLGRYVCEMTGKDHVVIETMKADLDILRSSDIHEGVPTFNVTIAPVSFDLDTLPMVYPEPTLVNGPVTQLSDTMKFTALSIPNPHLISVVDRIEDSMIALAEQANTDKSLFPRGVNVSFIQPLGNSSIFVLTYERGVGITNACGTAMSASSLVSCLLGIAEFNQTIHVYNKGGMVNCFVNKKDGEPYTVQLIGNSTYVFAAEIDFDFENPSLTKELSRTEFPEESAAYDRLVEASRSMLPQTV